MEYYWELHSKDAQNIKALMCPLYHHQELVHLGVVIFYLTVEEIGSVSIFIVFESLINFCSIALFR